MINMKSRYFSFTVLLIHQLNPFTNGLFSFKNKYREVFHFDAMPICDTWETLVHNSLYHAVLGNSKFDDVPSFDLVYTPLYKMA